MTHDRKGNVYYLSRQPFEQTEFEYFLSSLLQRDADFMEGNNLGQSTWVYIPNDESDVSVLGGAVEEIVRFLRLHEHKGSVVSLNNTNVSCNVGPVLKVHVAW